MSEIKNNFYVEKVNRKQVKNIIEKYHYTSSIFGVKSKYCFGLYNNENNIVGGMLYGELGMPSVWKKYVDNKRDILELRRLATKDNLPTNTESYFIGQTIKWLINNTLIKKIISYADPNYGHDGTIYQATNFEYLGQTKNSKVIHYKGEKYHDKYIRTKYNGELEPFAKELRQALKSGKANMEISEGKHIYLYNLENKRTKRQERKIKNEKICIQDAEISIKELKEIKGIGSKTIDRVLDYLNLSRQK